MNACESILGLSPYQGGKPIEELARELGLSKISKFGKKTTKTLYPVFKITVLPKKLHKNYKKQYDLHCEAVQLVLKS